MTIRADRGQTVLTGRALQALKDRSASLGHGLRQAAAGALRLDGARPLSQGAVSKVPGMELAEGGRAETPRRPTGPTSARIGATMERLTGAPVEVTVREASALLERMGFEGDLLGQVQRAGFRFREMTPDEVKKGKNDGEVGGVTYEHDRVTIKPTATFRSGKESEGPPTIALNPGAIIDLRVFVATGGRGLDGVSALAPTMGSGTPEALRRSLGILLHEMTHARLSGLIASGQPWVAQELTRIRQIHGVDEARARDILQEACGYHVQGLASAWATGAIYLQRGDRPGDVARLYDQQRQDLMSSPTEAYVHGRPVSHQLSPESQRALGRLLPSLDEGPRPVRLEP